MKTKLFVQLTNVRKFSNLITDTNKINSKVIICILPSIQEMDELLAVLNTTLSNLNPSNHYSLEFSLFLHTNFYNRFMIYIDSGIGSIYTDKYLQKDMYFSAAPYLYSKMKNHGYNPIFTYLFNLNELENLDNFVFDCYETLVDYTLHINSNSKEFFEFERPLLLRITKI